jgi:peptidoglycan/xylan/chitin deacetylase (PgdA/CDA1 family)
VGLPGLSRFVNLAKRPLLRMRTRGLVLLYHRVADTEPDPQLLCVSPRNFEQHLEILRTYWRPTSLGRLAESIRECAIDHRSAVVTFDDGYADNLYNAKPLLERYGVPATVFVSSGYLNAGREFWWDELERLLLGPGELPQEMALSVNGQRLTWDLAETASYTMDQWKSDRNWTVLDKDDPSPRHRAFRGLCDVLGSHGAAQRTKVLSQLRGLTCDNLEARSTHLALSRPELARLASDGLVDIGAHTVNHVRLSALPPADQAKEIENDKKNLEDTLGRGVDFFSYPFGSPNDYTKETVSAVKRAGFRLACSNFSGLVVDSADLFEVPRFIVRDWDGAEFAARLERWFRG